MPAELLRRAAAATPDGVAITVVDGDRLTYADWVGRSAAQARGLARAGIGASDAVALLFEARQWTDYAVAYVAVHSAGAIPVPLSRDLSAVEISRAVRLSGTVAIVAAADADLPAWVAPEPIARLDPRSLEAAGAEPGARAADGPPPPPPRPREILCPSRPLALTEMVWRSTSEILAGDPWLALARRSPWNGPLLHTQPVGTRAGQSALLAVLLEPRTAMVVLPAFDAERVAELVASGSVGACLLHPALADAALTSAVARDLDVAGLGALILSPGAAPADILDRVRRALPTAAIVEDTVPGHGAASAEQQPGDSLVSTAQEGLLWHEFFAPGCQNLPGLARRLRGPLDVGALDRALTEIVRRHRPLRTTYELRGGRLRQQVQPEPPSVLAIRDLTSLDASQRATEVDRVVADAGRRPFDLAAGPLFAPALLRLDAEDHVLVIRTHHLAFDEWSVGNFRRELGALYDAFAGGGESPLPEPSVAFDDLAARRRTALAGPEGARQLDHWRRELAGAPLVTQLPVGDPGLPFGTPQPAGGPVVLTLSKEVSDAVRDLARRQRATVFMTLLAAAGVVTGREMGRDDVLLSTIVANRDGAGLGGLIGLFAKKVPVRLRLGGDPTFVEVLARTRRALVGALSAQDLPFEALIQEILAPAAARHGAVPHLAVLVQSVSQGPALSLAGLTTQGLDTARRAPLAHFMAAPAAATPPPATRPWGSGLYWGTFVNLSLDETAAQLTCTARGAFHAPAVRTLLDDLADLIAAVTEDPGRTLSGIRPGSRSPVGASSTDAVDVRGFRIEPARIEACLRECPGVRGVMVHVERDADGEPEIVADVLPDGAPPTIERLRAHLWSRLPGYAWPASIRVSSGPPSGGEGDEGGEASPTAAILHALHREAAGGVGVPDAYWQSFPFLEALSMARDAGVAVPARLAARNRTVEALATAIAAEREASNRGAGPGIR